MRTGITGVRKFMAAIGAATRNPSRAPSAAVCLAPFAIQPSREQASGER
jgi:hypothetical protein